MFILKALILLLFSAGVAAQDLSNPFSLDEEPAVQKAAPRAQETLGSQSSSATKPEETVAEHGPEERELPSKPTIPSLNSPVVDKANLLSNQDKTLLEKKIRKIHQQNGPQLQIFILESLNGFPIEDYSIAVAEAWKIGKKDKGDGVLILMSKNDREVRIEVGQGIEGELTDVESYQIIQQIMIPAFRQGLFGKGFEGAVDAIASEFGMSSYGERDLSPPKDLAKIRRSKEQMVSIILPLIIFFVTFPLIAKLLGKNPIVRSFVGASYLGALTFFLVGHLFFIVLAVVFGFLIGFIGPLNFLMVMLSQGGRGRHYGGGGGFGGGGGWSGGGGGFSGGGASGRW